MIRPIVPTVIAAVAAAALLAIVGCSVAPPSSPVASAPPDAAAVTRGEYLANAANCRGCHTDKEHGGAPFAGGKAIDTSFGAYVWIATLPYRSFRYVPQPITGPRAPGFGGGYFPARRWF